MFFNVCSRCLSRQWGMQPIRLSRTLLSDTRGSVPVISIKEVFNELRDLVGSSISWDKPRHESVYRMRLAEGQWELGARGMRRSYREACIPLGSDEVLREKYVSHSNVVRFGRIMEDLDLMAVLIGYTHCREENQDKSPLSIVTGMVDRIDVTFERPMVVDSIPVSLGHQKQLAIDRDVFLRGHVTWVGASSMEITMQVEQEHQGQMEKILEAQFLMVARDPSNKKKAFVPHLHLATPEEETLVATGKHMQAMRQHGRTKSLMRHPPDDKERSLVHNVFLDTLDEKRTRFKASVKPHNSEWMEKTKLKTVLICFPEQRNIYNKIFGGFLMRQAFELAWISACLHSKDRIYTVSMDDITFQNPVEVGSFLYISSRLIYTQGPYMQVKVHAELVDRQKSQYSTTNIFQFTFACAKMTDVPEVIPVTYAEYMMYLEGKRHFDKAVGRMDPKPKKKP